MSKVVQLTCLATRSTRDRPAATWARPSLKATLWICQTREAAATKVDRIREASRRSCDTVAPCEHQVPAPTRRMNMINFLEAIPGVLSANQLQYLLSSCRVFRQLSGLRSLLASTFAFRHRMFSPKPPSAWLRGVVPVRIDGARLKPLASSATSS